MFTAAIHGEVQLRIINYNNIPLELVSVPATIWCGALEYAPNCTDEPDIGGLLQRYQEHIPVPKAQTADPGWSCAISIRYWQEGAAPRGMMFAQQVLTEKQDERHDIFSMPESLFIRVKNSAEVAQAAFNKETCELHELFGVIKNSLDDMEYRFAANGAQEIEMYNWKTEQSYAYVPVEQVDKTRN